MSYLLFKLHFETAVHFGTSGSALSLETSTDHFRADTLFSALCHIAYDLGGNERVVQLCDWVKDGRLRFSDSFPYCGNEFYLPKPTFIGKSVNDVSSAERKKMKKLSWISASTFSDFEASLRGETVYALPDDMVCFGDACETVKVGIGGNEHPEPFKVGLYRFRKDCGLYFIASAEGPDIAEELTKLIRILGISGIGGKVSSGYGRFTAEQTDLPDFFAGLDQAEGHQLLLTTSLPAEDELQAAVEGAFYQIVRRGGFMQSERDTDETGTKKATQYFFDAGSVFRRRYDGALYRVGSLNGHNVYRYAKPLFMGVKLTNE